MDHFCIERGTLLDNPSIVTLESPEEHSFHCLLDVQVCYESGFQVLGVKNEGSGLHELCYRLDDSDAVIAAGRASGQDGYCSTCRLQIMVTRVHMNARVSIYEDDWLKNHS
jgi:hypothetical protein